MRLTVNGQPREYTGDPAQPLLWYLRDELALTGTKFACGTGQCGACTVHVDGRPVNACLELAALAEGQQITTIEGYSPPDGSLTPLQEAIVTCADVQCGYCVPGMVMSAAALITESPGATAEDVREGLCGNLCRCTAYGGFVEAVRQVVYAHDELGLREARARQNSVMTRLEAANNRIRVREAYAGTKVDEAFARFETLERRVDLAEGRADALGMGSQPKTLEEEIAELRTSEKVDAELAALKAAVKKG